jgi:DNA invertase Pin-like site-specific DNA recombinase
MPRQKRTGREIMIGDLVEIISGEHWGTRARVIKADKSKGSITVELMDALVPMILTYERDHLRHVNGAGSNGAHPDLTSTNGPSTPPGDGIERVCIYARPVGSDGPSDPSKRLSQLREYASSHGLGLTGEYVEQPSADKDSRPALMAMLGDARGRKFQAILTSRLNVLSENLRDVRVLLEELRRNGITLICTEQELDTSGAAGDMVLRTLDAVADLSMEVKRSRAVPRLVTEDRDVPKRRGRKKIEISNELLLKAYQDCRGNVDGIKSVLAGQGIKASTWLIRARLKGMELPKLEPPPGTSDKQRPKRKRLNLTDEVILDAFQKGGGTVKGARDVLLGSGISPSYSLVYLRLKRLGKAGQRIEQSPPVAPSGTPGSTANTSP